MKVLISLFLSIFCWQLIGQYQIGLIPRISPDKAVYQKIGYTEVEIKYGSPSVNDRTIWGDLVPYDNVWRAGANNATTIEFSTPVIIDEQEIPEGIYSIFVIPRQEDRWTMMLNSEAEQWGAFSYDSNKDVVRIDIGAEITDRHVERLEYVIDQKGYQNGKIRLNWDSISLALPFEIDYQEQFRIEVESRVTELDSNIKWVAYLQGAEHLVETNSNLELANHWIDKSIGLSDNVKIWNKQFYPQEYIRGHALWVKANILARAGKFAEALHHFEKMKNIEGEMTYYKRRNKNGEIDILASSWKDK